MFDEGVTGEIFEDQSFSHQTQWSGSARIFKGGKVKLFFTAVAFYRNAAGTDVKPYDPRIVLSVGKVHADKGVKLTGFHKVTTSSRPTAVLPDRRAEPVLQLPRPVHLRGPRPPGQDLHGLRGQHRHAARGPRSAPRRTSATSPATPSPRTVDEVNTSGAPLQIANVGLAKATNDDLTSGSSCRRSCRRTASPTRPSVRRSSSRTASPTSSPSVTGGPSRRGSTGPRASTRSSATASAATSSPLNRGSGLALGNPTNLNYASGLPFDPDYNQHPGHFQAYSHYVMPGGLVQSFIDTIGTKDDFLRGGTLAPTVRLDIAGETTTVDYSYGDGGLGGWADVPAKSSSAVHHRRPLR